MEQRLRKVIAVFLISVLTLSTTSAVAATTSPKPTSKPTSKPTVKATGKATPTAKTKATKKPVAKKKKVVKKKKKKLPPLQPVFCYGKTWPPTGFTPERDVYAKVPTKAELGCESSDNYTPGRDVLRADLKKCDEFACGAVTVASEIGCFWWEINSTFERIDLKTGKIEATLGTLRTLGARTKPKVIQSIMLVSEIKHKDSNGKILNNIKASGIEVICHQDNAPDLAVRNIFKAN
jgi:hypothetical protein